MDPTNSNNLYVGALNQAGVFRTTNAGGAWTGSVTGLPNAGSRNITGLTVVAAVPNRVYAATLDGVYVSNDSGATWTAANAGMTGLNIQRVLVDPGDVNLVYAASAANGIYVSRDGGTTWQTFNAGLTNLNTRDLLRIPASPPRLAIATVGGGVFQITP